jgi:hypothetical protein
MPHTHEVLIQRVVAALNAGDYDEYEKLLTDDYLEEYPQSGEVIRGRKNSRAIREHYPGGPLQGGDRATARLAATDARWVRTPAFTVVRIEGTGNVGAGALRTRYPDGSLWWVVIFYELRGDRIARGTFFFAREFAPPEWRTPFVDTRTGPT